MVRKLLAVAIVIGLFISFLTKWIWWVIAVFVGLFIIRLLADLYWMFKDKYDW